MNIWKRLEEGRASWLRSTEKLHVPTTLFCFRRALGSTETAPSAPLHYTICIPGPNASEMVETWSKLPVTSNLLDSSLLNHAACLHTRNFSTGMEQHALFFKPEAPSGARSYILIGIEPRFPPMRRFLSRSALHHYLTVPALRSTYLPTLRAELARWRDVVYNIAVIGE